MSHANVGLPLGATVRARVAEELRNRILTGALSPGERLSLEALTGELGASRTPIREALLELSYEGLVEVAPRSRITVVGLGPQDVLDNFTLLGTLAGKAAEWAAERMSGEDLEEINELAAAVEADRLAGRSLVQANWRFHRAVHRASCSPRIITLIRQTVGVVPTNFFEVFPDQGSHSVSDHQELVAALIRRDGAAARVVAERHVAEAGAELATFLHRQGAGRARGRRQIRG